MDKVKYRGDLNKPVDVEIPRRPNALFGPKAELSWREEIRRIEASIEQERTRRWALLREHLGIAPECSWEDVALTLAVTHVPGMIFRQRPKVGRTKFWTPAKLRELRHDIDQLIAKGATVEAACATLNDEKRWTATAATLRTKYYSKR